MLPLGEQNLSAWSKKYVEVDGFVKKWPLALCKKGCYTVLYNACIRVLCTRYTRVIRMCITLRMDTLYTVAYNNYSITLCITSV